MFVTSFDGGSLSSCAMAVVFSFFSTILMGSFRSQPDLQKFTVSKTGLGLTFAVSHMCGKQVVRQAGASTWRTPTSMNPPSKTRKTPSSGFSTDTEVLFFLLRSGSLNFHRTPLHQRTRIQQKLPGGSVRVSSEGDLYAYGRHPGFGRGSKGDRFHPNIDEEQGQRPQVLGRLTCWMHC